MTVALYTAAALLVVCGFVHSYLGERYILIRLFRRDNIPHLLGGREFTVNTLRFAWHITSLAWVGFAAILVLLARPPVRPGDIGTAIGLTFVLTGAIALLGSKGWHLSWILFLAVGIITLIAT